jgi:hypothetical protein
MKVPGWIYGSYQSQAFTADQERTVNLLFENIESPGPSKRAALYPTPGVETLSTAAVTPGRAHFYENNREFAVIGAKLFEIDSFGNQTERGDVALDSSPATISSNGDGGGELFITSGGNGYIFTLATNTLSQIAALNGKATMGDHLDGYFLALDASNSRLHISNLLDGTTWDTGTDFAQRSIASDPWKALKVVGRYIWLLGEVTSEVWYNVGTTFPFAPYPSGLIQFGIAAPFSAAIADGQLLWLGNTRFGGGYVLKAAGFQPEAVSNFATQKVFDEYDTISNAEAFAYADLGHTHYVLSFPSEDTTWNYDLQTRLWTERGTWVPASNAYVAWRPRWHVRAFNEHRVLDASGGQLYRMRSDLMTDVDGLAIRRLRRGPAMETENEQIYYTAFELDLDPGQGTVTGQGANPQVMMRMSNDGGKTWGIERWRSAGKIGEYQTRVRWDRLGRARRRVFEVVMTDPAPWRITNAYVELAQRPATLGGGGAR